MSELNNPFNAPLANPIEDRVRYLEARIERLCSEAAQSDYFAREYLKRVEIAEAKVKELETELKFAEQAPKKANDRDTLELNKLLGSFITALTRNNDLVRNNSYLRSTAKLNEPSTDDVHMNARHRILMAETLCKIKSVLVNMKSISSGQKYLDSVGLQAWFDRRLDEALRHINEFNQASLVTDSVSEIEGEKQL